MGNGRGRGDKELGIRLMERDVGGVSAGYRDEQPREDGVGNGNGTVRQEELFNYDMSRRDSDALGSLAVHRLRRGMARVEVGMRLGRSWIGRIGSGFRRGCLCWERGGLEHLGSD